MKALLLLCTITLTFCGCSRAADMQVTDVWAQPVNASGTAAAVYMTISDKCSRPEKLTSVVAKLPQKASLHTSSVVDNALRMTPLPFVAVECDAPTRLKPMGTHVMVTGIAKAVQIGDRLPLTLVFDASSNVDVVAEVTTLAVLENVDPMHMYMKPGAMKGMHMP